MLMLWGTSYGVAELTYTDNTGDTPQKEALSSRSMSMFVKDKRRTLVKLEIA